MLHPNWTIHYRGVLVITKLDVVLTISIPPTFLKSSLINNLRHVCDLPDFLFLFIVLGKVVTIDHVILGAISYSLFVCDESGGS